MSETEETSGKQGKGKGATAPKAEKAPFTVCKEAQAVIDAMGTVPLVRKKDIAAIVKAAIDLRSKGAAVRDKGDDLEG